MARSSYSGPRREEPVGIVTATLVPSCRNERPSAVDLFQDSHVAVSLLGLQMIHILSNLPGRNASPGAQPPERTPSTELRHRSRGEIRW